MEEPSPSSALFLHRTKQRLATEYLAARGSREPHLIYLVPFAAPDYATATREGWGDEELFFGAIEGVRALDVTAADAERRRRSVRTSTLLFEEDPLAMARLRATLDAAGWGRRIRQGIPEPQPTEWETGEIWLISEPFASVVDRVVAELTEAEIFCFADPPAPGKLSLTAVRALRENGAELFTVFPSAPLERLERVADFPLADLPPPARRSVESVSAALGDERHGWFVSWRDALRSGGAEAAEATVLERYEAALLKFSPPATLRSESLVIPGARWRLHLFLLTAEPERVLLLNRTVRAARMRGEAAWSEDHGRFVVEEESGVLELFATPGGPPSRTRRVDLAAVAHAISTEFAGRSVPFRDVLGFLAQTQLFSEEVRRAMSLLRKERRARYRSLHPDAEVSFAEKGGRFGWPERVTRREAEGELRMGLAELDAGEE